LDETANTKQIGNIKLMCLSGLLSSVTVPDTGRK
jgi:hypothetical protein